MSLDIELIAIRPKTVFETNLTHNLVEMAREAGLYEVLWRPEEIPVLNAGGLATLLALGIEKLKAEPERFKKLNPANGWGDYEGLLRVTESYLEACKENPDATISVCR